MQSFMRLTRCIKELFTPDFFGGDCCKPRRQLARPSLTTSLALSLALSLNVENAFFSHQKQSLGPRSNLVVRVVRDFILTRSATLESYC